MPIKSAGGVGGVVTKEFLAYRSANQSIGNASWTRINCDTEVFDPDGVYDNATNYRYTPVELGTYLLYGGAQLENLANAKAFLLSIYKNGSDIARVGETYVGATGSWPHLNGMCLAQVASSTDYFDLRAYHNHGSARNINGGSSVSYFGGYKLPT